MSDGELIATTEAALAAAPNRRALPIEHLGQHYIAKRLAAKPRSLTQTLLMRWLTKAITGEQLPLRTLQLSNTANDAGYEADRLQALAEAGVRVPHVAHRSNEYLLLKFGGTDVATLLESWTRTEWRVELTKLAAELGIFHAAGHWHGAAQIKNIVFLDGVYRRIDFEENFGEFLSPPVNQTMDLVLFLNSISLAGPIDEAEAHYLLPVLIGRYFAANPQGKVAIRDVLLRTLPHVKRLAWLARPFGRFSRKGLRRVNLMIVVLEDFLNAR